MNPFKLAYVRAFYWWSMWTSNGILWTISRWKVEGRENVPGGPLILASNHLGNVDPMILAIAIRSRRIRFMAKTELFESILSPFVRSWAAIRLYRGASDRQAMREAEATVRNGDMLGMFPEGTRNDTGELGELHKGTALIALRTNTPILPVRLFNTNRLGKSGDLFPRPHVKARIGKPIPVVREQGSLSAQVAALTDRLRDELEALRDERQEAK